ncbi:hypothetical protein FBU30_005734 [Linnemannia zychae]|nr:hypothetical protein FBU30_005734 [Linnemannia zychae]
MNSNTTKTTGDILRRQNALRMLDTILSSSLSSSPPPPSPTRSPLPSRRKQPLPPSSQDTLAAFVPHMADKGYQPDTDDIGSNDDNSDSHDDLFCAGDLSALLMQQNLERQEAARKLQSNQLKQRQLLMQQHQRIFQDNQQLHSTSDRALQSPISSHIPGKAHTHKREDGEEQEEDNDEEEEEDDDSKTQATPRHSVGTPKRDEHQHQYDVDNGASQAQYQESDDDNNADAPAPSSNEKKPKARGRPKGVTAETTPSKTIGTSSRSQDKPKRQYKKTILRQQAALLAAQIKDENEARNTEATRRVLARTGIIKHARSLKHRLDLAQYKIDKGLQEQPLHIVVEVFEDSLDDDYCSDNESEDNHTRSNHFTTPNLSEVLSIPKPRRSSLLQSPLARRTKLSTQLGLHQRNAVTSSKIDSKEVWPSLGSVNLEDSSSESDSDGGFPDTPTKPRSRFSISDSIAKTPPRPIRPLTETLVLKQRLPATPMATPVSKPVITPLEDSDASTSSQSESDVAGELRKSTASPLPNSIDALMKHQEQQLAELQRLQQQQLQELQEEQRRTLQKAQSQWALHQKSAPSRTPPRAESTSSSGSKTATANSHLSKSTPSKQRDNCNPFQEATPEKERRLRQEHATASELTRQSHIDTLNLKSSASKPPLPLGVHQRTLAQIPSSPATTPDRISTASLNLTPVIPTKAIGRANQDSFATPQRRPTKSPSPAVRRQRNIELTNDIDGYRREKSSSPFTPKQLEERERQKEKIRENQLREQELLRKQRELEHQQRQQSRRKRLLLQLQYQHLQEQNRFQSLGSRNQKNRIESVKSSFEHKTGDETSRVLFPPSNNTTITPKKKKPLNPVQKAPSTENILASVRSQQSMRSNMIAASSALASAKTVLLGNKRVLSMTEDKENVPSSLYSPMLRDHSTNGNQSPITNRLQSQEKTYKRQKPAVPSSPLLSLPARSATVNMARWTISDSKPAQQLNSITVSANTALKHVNKSSNEDLLKSNNSGGVKSSRPMTSLPIQGGATIQTNKEFLNCFDQWMSDLGRDDVTSQGLPLNDTSAPLSDSTTDSVLSTFTKDHGSRQLGSFHDIFASGAPPTQDNGAGTEPDESEIDQLLYSDFGDDYAVYGGGDSGGGQENIETPGSEPGQLDLTADFMKADFYDWFPDSFREQAVADIGTVPLTPNEQHLSLLSTDPILSSSPAELSQGLELDLDFDAAAAAAAGLSWSQQQYAALPSPQFRHSQQLQSSQSTFSSQVQRGSPSQCDLLSSSRAGTPPLDSSGSLMSSSFTEILPPVVDIAVPGNHYVPMGLGGQIGSQGA